MDIKNIMKFGIDEVSARKIIFEIEKYISTQISEKTYEIKKKYEKELLVLKNQAIVERELMLAGARNLKATMALIDLDDIHEENINLNFIKQKINELKSNENTKFLFFEHNQNNQIKGFRPFETNLNKDKSIKNMDYEELCKYYEIINNL